MSTIQVEEACVRIQNLTNEEVKSYRSLLSETVESLAEALAERFNHHSPIINRQLATTTCRAASARHTNLAPSNSANIVPASNTNSNALPILPTIDLCNERRGTPSTQVVQSSPKPRRTKIYISTSSTPQPKKPLLPCERAFKNAQSNSKLWLRDFKDVDVTEALTKRVIEYPPARAGGDISKGREYEPFVKLEGFFAAMVIAEDYHDYQGRAAKKSPNEKNPVGRPPKCYSEFVKQTGIANETGLESTIRFGEKLSQVWKYFPTQLGIFLLVDLLPTLRLLTGNDTKSLKRLVDEDQGDVKSLVSNLSASVGAAWEGYKQIALDCWSPEVRDVMVAKARKIMHDTRNVQRGRDSEGTEPERAVIDRNDTRAQPFKRARLDAAEDFTTATSSTHMNDQTGRHTPDCVTESPLELVDLGADMRISVTNDPYGPGEVLYHQVEQSFIQQDCVRSTSHHPASTSIPQTPRLHENEQLNMVVMNENPLWSNPNDMTMIPTWPYEPDMTMIPSWDLEDGMAMIQHWTNWSPTNSDSALRLDFPYTESSQSTARHGSGPP